jgi:hypothetical protein
MWFELHSHSWYSKGKILGEESVDSPIQMVKEARRKGLQGIAITDHDSFKNWNPLKNLKFNDFVVIPGEEIYTKQGHLIGLGITEEIKPKQDVLETIDKIHSQGGIAIAPHPFDIGRFGIGNFAKYADAIEIFNSGNMDRISNLRAKKFAKKVRKPAVVGTDAHMKEVIGRSATKLQADFDLDSILKAIKNGKIMATRTKYLAVKEVTDWYIGRINRNYEKAVHHIESNYNFVKRTTAKTLLKLSDRESILSRGIVYGLSYFSLLASTGYSSIINLPRCLV